MRSDFHYITPEDAVGVLCLLVGIAIAWFAVEEPKVTLPVPPRVVPRCVVTVAQYGPGERFVPQPPVPACAGGMVELPPHLLTFPIQEPQ